MLRDERRKAEELFKQDKGVRILIATDAAGEGINLQRAPEKSKSVKVQREVDFVANQGSRRYYIQVAFEMPDKEKEEQEKASLRGINDSFKKIIIVGNPIKVKRDEDGFTTMSIWDFLLKENSLEL